MQENAIVIADTTGTIHVWSPGAETLFGWSAAEAVGQSLDLIVPERQRERHWARFHESMRTNVSTLDGNATELPVQTRRDGVIKFPARFIFLRDAQGRAIGAMGVFDPRAS